MQSIACAPRVLHRATGQSLPLDLSEEGVQGALKDVLVVEVVALYSIVSLAIADEEHLLSTEDSRTIPH